MLKRELVRGIVISNTCVKLYRNWIINEVARAGEHTNERTYIRTYSHTYVRDRPYIPSTTLLCEGITKLIVGKRRVRVSVDALVNLKTTSCQQLLYYDFILAALCSTDNLPRKSEAQGYTKKHVKIML